MAEIFEINAREILDSRGNPTVEVDVRTVDGVIGRAAVPSGASTGEHEAVELRDGDASRFLGRGVSRAVVNVVDELAPQIVGFDVNRQLDIDRMMIEADGTPNKSKIGANAILGVSLACARAASISQDLPLYRYLGGVGARKLPVPMMNILNGGAHADNNVDIQEIMVVPHGFEGFEDALRAGVEVFHSLKNVLGSRSLPTAVGDEGGFAPDLESNEASLVVVLEAIEKAGYRPSEEISIALDAAASAFYDSANGKYVLDAGKTDFDSAQLVDFWDELCSKYPIISIEDGMSERDWEGFCELNKRIGDKVQIVGDDLFVTNSSFIEKGIRMKAANSVLVKVNQIGTLTETFEAVEQAHRAGWTTIISHRSGETEDVFIADLSVATNSGQIKTGSASRSDRTAKYNQLLRIAEDLGDEATFAGTTAFQRRE